MSNNTSDQQTLATWKPAMPGTSFPFTWILRSLLGNVQYKDSWPWKRPQSYQKIFCPATYKTPELKFGIAKAMQLYEASVELDMMTANYAERLEKDNVNLALFRDCPCQLRATRDLYDKPADHD